MYAYFGVLVLEFHLKCMDITICFMWACTSAVISLHWYGGNWNIWQVPQNCTYFHFSLFI